MIDDYACNPGFRCIMGIISKIGYVYLFFLLACFGIGCIGYTITELTDNTPQVPDTSWKYDFSDMEGRYANNMYDFHYSATITSDGRCVMEYIGMAEVYQLTRNSKEPIADAYLNGEFMGRFEVVDDLLLMETDSEYIIPMYRTA